MPDPQKNLESLVDDEGDAMPAADQIRQAQRVVAAHAEDVEEARMFLTMLGIAEAPDADRPH